MKPLAYPLVAAMLTCAPPAAAEEPDLTGTWIVESGATRTTSGETIRFGSASTFEFEITDQDGPVFSGTYRWLHPETMQDMHDGQRVTHQAAENFVGVIHHDNKTLTFADHPDTGVYVGRLVGDNRIEMIGYESGPHAFAGRATMVRQ